MQTPAPDLTPPGSQFSPFSSCRWYTIPPPQWYTFSPQWYTFSPPLYIPGEAELGLTGSGPLYGTQERWGPCELTPLAHQLFEAAERVNAGLVVMDSVAAIYLANENDRAEVRGFLSALARRAYEGDRSVLLLAHPPKSGSDYSGSTDWLAGVRALWTLGPRRGSFMPHAELATSWRMNTSGCRFCRRSAPAPDAGGYITGPRPEMVDLGMNPSP